jgi:hypothetical protein
MILSLIILSYNLSGGQIMALKYYALCMTCLLLQVANLAQEQKPTVDDFAWLAGCWSRSGNGRETVEHWMKPAGQTMLGMSRTVANGKTREYEFLQIRQQENGDIYYVALPSGQKETWFKLVKGSGRDAVFENPEHDFPQRIIYRLESDGSLFARIEGTSKGKEKGIDFPMKRAKCD